MKKLFLIISMLFAINSSADTIIFEFPNKKLAEAFYTWVKGHSEITCYNVWISRLLGRNQVTCSTNNPNDKISDSLRTTACRDFDASEVSI